MSGCSIEGCDNQGRIISGQWCEMHYMRQYRTGSFDLKPNNIIPKDAICAIEGCEKDCRRGRNTENGPICRMHAVRLERNGTIHALIAASDLDADASMEQRFLTALTPGDLQADGSHHILFTGHIDNDNYGRIGTTKRPTYPFGYELAHRYAWKYWIGPIPKGHDLDHRPECPKNCVNPEHLQLVTRSEHMTIEAERRGPVVNTAILTKGWKTRKGLK